MMTEEQKKEMEFITNPENIFNCDNCPRNGEFDRWGGNQPCGQQHCWVEINCTPDPSNQ